MLARINIFLAWFLIPQTLTMGWVAAIGRIVLELLGVNTYEGDIPGRMVGALLLFAAVYLVLHFRGSLPPEGKPEGKGFRFGHRLLLAANLLAALFIIFQFTHLLIDNRDLFLVLDGFTNAFGVWTMALWVVGFSFIYQSALPKK
ncbi:MAG: hypothetical protein Q7U78_14540 [Gallionella sp.]|nr:hypothetical protein [Gallionella sp.]